MMNFMKERLISRQIIRYICLFAVTICHINPLSAQQANCLETLDWVIETFSTNDAGYDYIIEKKGKDHYNQFTQELREKAKTIQTDEECVALVRSWLAYFRKGHIAFVFKDVPSPHTEETVGSVKAQKIPTELQAKPLSNSTFYIRIPSFDFENKAAIDSLIQESDAVIQHSPNLIIDIRNGTGGSDSSFEGLMKYLYTNPIRDHSVVFKGSELNAKEMEYYGKQQNNPWFNEIATKLRDNKGEWVPVDDEGPVSFIRLDEVLKYPQRIAILINGVNISTDEQFLLYAKQSWKVKLFGRTTFGAIDISNMSFAPSPCGKYYLAYAMSRSVRIPHFTVDDIGLQPDFYMDDEISDNDWVKYAQDILEGLN